MVNYVLSIGFLACYEGAQHILIVFMETILLMTNRNKIILRPYQRGTVAQLIESFTGDRRIASSKITIGGVTMLCT